MRKMTLAHTPRPCEGPNGRKCFVQCPECREDYDNLRWYMRDLIRIKEATNRLVEIPKG